ncbi:MAG: translation initiation factor IF-2 [Methylococcales bacterium]|nr:translation initiation factor IF-2 [Methylococcales bacterium]
MSDKTVRQLADMVKTPLEQLLKQLQEAGLSVRTPDDIINDDEQMRLLTHLRKSHGKGQGEGDNSPNRVTLARRKVTEIKQASVPGISTKTISVEVRKKKTYIKRADVDEVKVVEPTKVEVEALKQPVEIEAVAPVEIIAPVVEVSVQQPELEVKADEQPIAEIEVEPEVDIDSEAKFEALKLKEEKKNKEKSAKTKEAEEVRKKQQEKERRLEESIKKNADKVRQQAAKPATTPNRKSQDEGGGGGNTRSSGKEGKRGKRNKGKQAPQRNVNQPEGKHQFEMPSAPIVYDVTIPEMIIVSDLAQKMNIKAAAVIKHLMKLGIMATINQTIDQDTAAILVEEMGHKPIMQSEDDLEQEMLAEALEEDNRVEQPRAPIVTIMGHVDHGKTSLLDYIRKTRVAAGEAGGITQHIGAYQVKTDHGSVTFLDTPGHAAFTAMRARGADVTDVVIIVVAADDGVMPQTKEAVEHAKAANVPIIVAMNKMDKPGVNPDKVMQELSSIGVQPEEWGGDVQFLQISAKTGLGIDELIEALIVQTEILELKAPVEGAASGIVIESRLDKGRGAVATVLIQKGTLENGQMVLCGHEYGRVRAMFNENGKPIKEAGPCEPVEILGLSGTPNAGDEFLVVQNERVAKDLAKHREDRKKFTRHAAQQAAKLDEVFSRMTTGELACVNLVLKTDVQGSLEALRSSLVGLSNDEVEVKVVYGGVGGITEGDANLALASGAILMGFNVRADATARKMIEEKGIDLHYYSIIYEAIDEVKKSISGMLAPEIKETIVGLAEVRDVFKSPKFGAIAGCMVVDGFVKRNLPIRVLRDNVVIYEGQLESLRRIKDDVAEVKMGIECGIGVKNYNDVRVGDQIEVFERTEVKREL